MSKNGNVTEPATSNVTVIEEGTIRFTFGEEFDVIKFDEASFFEEYKRKKIKINNGKSNKTNDEKMSQDDTPKGVDFLAIKKAEKKEDEKLYLIEVKNCLGYERENKYRLATRGKRESAEEVDNKGTFAQEIPRKVYSSVTGMLLESRNIDHFSLGHPPKNDKEHEDHILKKAVDMYISGKEIIVILVLEGDFFKNSVIGKHKIKNSPIQTEIKAELRKWLNSCSVSVRNISELPGSIKAEFIKNNT